MFLKNQNFLLFFYKFLPLAASAQAPSWNIIDEFCIKIESPSLKQIAYNMYTKSYKFFLIFVSKYVWQEKKSTAELCTRVPWMA